MKSTTILIEVGSILLEHKAVEKWRSDKQILIVGVDSNSKRQALNLLRLENNGGEKKKRMICLLIQEKEKQ